jgi:Rrf2 family protein
MLSGTAVYALRAVTHLAGQPPGRPMRTSELAAAVDVPYNYLGKVLHQLVRTGILKSFRGKRGGFQLAVPAEEVTLHEIASLFCQIERPRCLLGRPECTEEDPCPLHERWTAAGLEIEKILRETKVADLTRG